MNKIDIKLVSLAKRKIKVKEGFEIKADKSVQQSAEEVKTVRKSRKDKGTKRERIKVTLKEGFEI